MISLGVLFAVLASVGFGLSDVLSGAVLRRHSTASLALWAQATGLVVLGATALGRRPELSWPGLGWGAAAGVVGALGVLAFYSALQRGRTSVVAPLAGAGVLVPVLVGSLSGDPLGWRAGAGVALVGLGTVLVAAFDRSPDDKPNDDFQPSAPSWGTGRSGPGTSPAQPRPAHPVRPVPGRSQPSPGYDGCVPRERDDGPRASVWLAVLAASLFGGFFVVLEHATDRATASNPGIQTFDVALSVSLAVQVGALTVTLLAASRHTVACLLPGRSLFVPAATVGLLDAASDLSLTLAVDRGPLAVVGPLGSLDPVVAVLVATLVLKERLRPLPALGVTAALAGIVLVAVT